MNKEEFEEIRTKFGKETKRKQISKWLNYVSILFATLGIALSSNYLLNNFITSDIGNNLTQNQILDLNKQILDLKIELKKSEKNAKNTEVIKQSSDESVKSSKEFLLLKNEVENLNNLILDSPEKAISVPLLKIEIENQKEQNEKDLKSIKEDISRVYDMNKWIIGLVFTMLVSIIVLNISNLFAKNKKE